MLFIREHQNATMHRIQESLTRTFRAQVESNIGDQQLFEVNASLPVGELFEGKLNHAKIWDFADIVDV